MPITCRFCLVSKPSLDCSDVHCDYWLCADCIRVCIYAKCPMFDEVPDTLVTITCPACRVARRVVRLVPSILRPGRPNVPSRDAIYEYIERSAATKTCRFSQRTESAPFWHACGESVVVGRMVCPRHSAVVDSDEKKRTDMEFLCDQVETLWK
jgi:hypothetical protein